MLCLSQAIRGRGLEPWALQSHLVGAPLSDVESGNGTPVGCGARFGEGRPGAVLPAPPHHRGVAVVGVLFWRHL